MVYQDPDLSSNLPSLSLRQWPCYLTLSQFSLLLHQGYNNTSLIGLIGGWNEMMGKNHLELSLSCSNHSIHIQFFMISLLLSVKVSYLINCEDRSLLPKVLVRMFWTIFKVGGAKKLYTKWVHGHWLNFTFNGWKIQGSRIIIYK